MLWESCQFNKCTHVCLSLVLEKYPVFDDVWLSKTLLPKPARARMVKHSKQTWGYFGAKDLDSFHMINEENHGPWLFRVYRGVILPNSVGIIIHH